MQLSIGAVQLIDTEDGSGDSIFGMSAEIERALQMLTYIDADSVGTIYRGNKKTTFGFSISRQHASIDAALLFLFTHEATLPTDATLLLASGQNNIRIDGNLQKTRSPIIGLRTTYAYVYVGGAPYANVLTTESGSPLQTEDGQNISL